MSAVRVFARIKSKPGNEYLVRQALELLVDDSRREAGVILYELYETIDGGEFMVNEEYRDVAAFEAHLASEHLKRAVEKVTPLLMGGVKLWHTKRIR